MLSQLQNDTLWVDSFQYSRDPSARNGVWRHVQGDKRACWKIGALTKRCLKCLQFQSHAEADICGIAEPTIRRAVWKFLEPSKAFEADNPPAAKLHDRLINAMEGLVFEELGDLSTL
ncbi:hypothetical protein ASG54_22810 [Aureimonas sp. Leaf460]|nr:hypothetical protein ASG62_24575 [Aureimonas sp. Leaf427]KQT64577.1 hypothetical protein ASG54_22810 [Aureimonas sp. Leaf460]